MIEIYDRQHIYIYIKHRKNRIDEFLTSRGKFCSPYRILNKRKSPFSKKKKKVKSNAKRISWHTVEPNLT